MRWLGVMLVFAGCNFSSTTRPDAPGEPGRGLGMFVDWNANPTLPGPLSDTLVVSEATFQLDHFQIVADAGSVTRTKYLLSWGQGAMPTRDEFPDAPPGVYSKVALVMTGGNFGDDAYKIHGMWRDSSNTLKPFEIHDHGPLSISFDCDAMLAAAGSATIAIRVDLRDAISGIDFTNVDEEDGVLDLHDGQALLDFRSRLQDAFKLDN